MIVEGTKFQLIIIITIIIISVYFNYKLTQMQIELQT